ncbi:MAG: phosphopantothenoylcysteine decarboxylase [Leptospiraceae bacterium]|nr:phosphopantothenoylcysteine decarboxylase [Leptospiraceae bacterium]
MNLNDFKLIVTSGPTREWLDPVRFISNPSTGQTGWQVARNGVGRFREVVYICGAAHREYCNVEGARNISVITTEDLALAVQSEVGPRSLLIMAAAPADFTPAHPGEQKIKKQAGAGMNLELKPTTDVLKSVSELDHTNFFRVGFAAETTQVREHALEKMERKKLHFVCANRVYREEVGFGSHDNTLFVLDREGQEETLGPCSKELLARHLLDYLILRMQTLSDSTVR